MTETLSFEYKYINQFKCLQDKCPASCCSESKWNIEVFEHEKNEHIEPIMRHVEGDRYIIAKDSSNRCLACSPTGICNIHQKYGENALPSICREYPRVITSLNGVTSLRSASGSCPEIMRYCLFEDDPFDIIPVDYIKGDPLLSIANSDLNNKEIFSLIKYFINLMENSSEDIDECMLHIIQIINNLKEHPYKDWLTELISGDYSKYKNHDLCRDNISSEPLALRDIYDLVMSFINSGFLREESVEKMKKYKSSTIHLNQK